MLVLTRKEGESICLGDEITITVQQLRGDTVRIAIDAPRDVTILRGELKTSADANKEAAAANTAAVDALKKKLGL